MAVQATHTIIRSETIAKLLTIIDNVTYGYTIFEYASYQPYVTNISTGSINGNRYQSGSTSKPTNFSTLASLRSAMSTQLQNINSRGSYIDAAEFLGHVKTAMSQLSRILPTKYTKYVGTWTNSSAKGYTYYTSASGLGIYSVSSLHTFNCTTPAGCPDIAEGKLIKASNIHGITTSLLVKLYNEFKDWLGKQSTHQIKLYFCHSACHLVCHSHGGRSRR